MELVRMKKIGPAVLLVICISSLLYAAQSAIVGVEENAYTKDDKSRKQTEQVSERQATEARKQVKRDGRFIAYGDGTVLDTQTNLMWAAKDNGSDINWANAKTYCEKYRGGGYTDWRLPTQNELIGLLDANKSQKAECGIPAIHIATDLIQLTCWWVWGSETRGSDAAGFHFGKGPRSLMPQSDASDGRALPVRLGK
jgi:hypothetical protein